MPEAMGSPTVGAKQKVSIAGGAQPTGARTAGRSSTWERTAR
jgi:hypothetical protein